MVMYGVYNSDTLEDLINTVHKLHNQTTWNERLFAGQIKDWYHWYLSSRGVNHYAINSLLFLTTAGEKYVKMYERFINQVKEYLQVIRILSQGYLSISLLQPSKSKSNMKIPSIWSDSDEGKDDQARAKPLDIQEPQPSTSSVNEPQR